MNLAFESEKDQKEKGTKDKVVGFMQKYVLAKSQKSSDDKENSSGGEAEAMTASRRQGRRGRRKARLWTDLLTADVLKTVGLVSKHSR